MFNTRQPCRFLLHSVIAFSYSSWSTLMHTESNLNASSRSIEQSILDEKLNVCGKVRDCWGFCSGAYNESTTHSHRQAKAILATKRNQKQTTIRTQHTNVNSIRGISVNKPSDDKKHGVLQCYTTQKIIQFVICETSEIYKWSFSICQFGGWNTKRQTMIQLWEFAIDNWVVGELNDIDWYSFLQKAWKEVVLMLGKPKHKVFHISFYDTLLLSTSNTKVSP